MITKVEVRTTAGTLLTLPLDDISDGFVIEGIDGLDPVKATITSSGFANLDGAQYQSSRRETRNIVLGIGLEPDYVTNTVRDLRTHLYQFFMPKSQVSLRFYMSDGLTVDILGRVESFESPLFTKEPAVAISVICFDPDFTELDPVEIDDETVADSSEILVTYNGSVETGIIFELDVDRTLAEFTIYHRPPDGVVRSLDFAASLVADDVVKIDTIVGEKSAILTRASTDSSVLYGVSPQSTWIQLQPGDNYLRVYAVGAAIPFSIKYTTRHGGL